MDSRSDVAKMGPKSKPKESKTSLSYCQRLIQNLDQSEAEPNKAAFERSKPPPPSRFLALPAEVRQHILYSILNDDELFALDLNIQAWALARICKTFKADMEWVLQQWQARKADLTKHQQLQRGAFDSYIADLMAPVISSARVLSRQKRLPRGPGQQLRTTLPLRSSGGREKWDKKIVEEKLARSKGGRGRVKGNGVSNRWVDRKWKQQSKVERMAIALWKAKRETRMTEEKTIWEPKST